MDNSRKTFRLLPVLFAVCLFGQIAYGKYSRGSGTAEDPYQIATAEDLMVLGEDPNDYDKHFILTADIDLDPNLPGGKVFDRAVIAADVNDNEEGFQGTDFAGVFTGNGHTIPNLTINGVGHLGLFGQLSSEAKVSNIALKAVAIYGTGDVVGGLVGEIVRIYGLFSIQTSISNSYSTGTVAGRGLVGGLVGSNYSNSIITTSYSTGIADGDSGVGGLVGTNGYDHKPPVYSKAGSIADSYWDIETSSELDMCGSQDEEATGCDPNYGLPTSQMKQQSTFEDWDFINVWDIGENQTYPYLRKYSAADINQDGSVNSLDLAILAENWLAEGR